MGGWPNGHLAVKKCPRGTLQDATFPFGCKLDRYISFQRGKGKVLWDGKALTGSEMHLVGAEGGGNTPGDQKSCLASCTHPLFTCDCTGVCQSMKLQQDDI